MNLEHNAMLMVHPVMGETISDPVTAKIWQKAFGKDFGGMRQGDTKTGMVSTDTMLIMTPEEVTNMPPQQICNICQHCLLGLYNILDRYIRYLCTTTHIQRPDPS